VNREGARTPAGSYLESALEGSNVISFMCHKIPPIYFLINILKFKTQILNSNVDLINFYGRCILLKFYDFWSSFDTRSNENKINESS
jgi:hypothetical protein